MLKFKKNRSLQSILRFTTSGDVNVKVCQQNENLTAMHQTLCNKKRIMSLVYIEG